MSIDYQALGNKVSDWCKDDSFFELRTTKQLCKILDNSVLSSQQFHEISLRVQKFFELSDTVEVLQHAHINFDNSSTDVFSVLDSLSQIFNFQFIKNLKTAIQSISNQSSKSEERINILKNIKTESDNHYTYEFQKLYDTIDEAARFEDKTTLKFAIDNNYLKIQGWDDTFHLKVCTYAASTHNLFLLKSLHNLGAERDDFSDGFSSILREFCRNGNLQGVKFAVEDCGVNINQIDVRAQPPLYHAARRLDYNICSYLCSLKNILKVYYDPNANKFAPIYDIIPRWSKSLNIQELLKMTDEEKENASRIFHQKF